LAAPFRYVRLSCLTCDSVRQESPTHIDSTRITHDDRPGPRIESSSPRLQRGAGPSQLPTRKSNKKARCRCDTGLCSSRRVELDQVSQAQRMRLDIRRLSGEAARIPALGDPWSQRSHGSSPNSCGAAHGWAAPGGCSRSTLPQTPRPAIWFADSLQKIGDRGGLHAIDPASPRFIPRRHLGSCAHCWAPAESSPDGNAIQYGTRRAWQSDHMKGRVAANTAATRSTHPLPSTSCSVRSWTGCAP
jgi:hypothetical protein